MNNEQVWLGGSGNHYRYTIYPINTKFDSNQNSNYIFCKLDNGEWKAVYIGQGDLKQRTESHIEHGCVLRKGATHIHAHLEQNESNRLREEEDLLLGNNEAYDPSGCNVRQGG